MKTTQSTCDCKNTGAMTVGYAMDNPSLCQIKGGFVTAWDKAVVKDFIRVLRTARIKTHEVCIFCILHFTFSDNGLI